MKKSLALLGTALAIGANAAPDKFRYESWYNLPEATVESVPASEVPTTSILMVYIRGRIVSHCNFGALPQGNVSADHCVTLDVEKDEGKYRDIIVEKSFTEFAHKLGYKHFSYATPRLPTPAKPTNQTLQELHGQILQIRGCLPDPKKDSIYCYKITGKAVQERNLPRGIFTIRLKVDEDKKIGSRRKSGSNSLGGMSGSPVFDMNGNFVGVYTMQHEYLPLGYIEMYPRK